MRRLFTTAALSILLVLSACAERVGDGTGGGSGGTPEEGTIHGVVLLGPTCPVVTIEDPCPDQPAQSVKVQAIKDGAVVASTVTGDDGAFSMSVAPGTYLVQAVIEPNGPGMSAEPTRVTVAAGAASDITVLLDTGIRAPVGS